jgi:hypothetical protein
MKKVTFPAVIKDGNSVITFTSENVGTYASGAACMSSLSDYLVRVEAGSAILVSQQPQAMFNISLTTFSMAKKRGLELTVSDCGEFLQMWELENDMEWLCSYCITKTGLQWNGNVYLPHSIKEELPAFIFTEKQLREVVIFIAESLK